MVCVHLMVNCTPLIMVVVYFIRPIQFSVHLNVKCSGLDSKLRHKLGLPIWFILWFSFYFMFLFWQKNKFNNKTFCLGKTTFLWYKSFVLKSEYWTLKAHQQAHNLKKHITSKKLTNWCWWSRSTWWSTAPPHHGCYLFFLAYVRVYIQFSVHLKVLV